MREVSAPTYENRRFTRVDLLRPATITLPSGDTVLGEIVELSICGLRFSTNSALPAGSDCTIRFALAEDETIEIKATIIRMDGTSTAAEITAIKEGCYGYFRKLLVESTEEPGVIDTELISRDDFVPQSY